MYRSEAYQAFFEFLESTGMFFYERTGDVSSKSFRMPNEQATESEIS